MSPKHFRKRQQGFLMPVAIFILVVMAVFGTTVARNSNQTNIATVQEGVSTQAFFAAESGAQRAMSSVFYGALAPTRASADAGCAALNASAEPEISFTAPGLANCTATLSCAASNDPDNTTSYYRLVSVANCGGGSLRASRSIEVSSFIKDL